MGDTADVTWLPDPDPSGARGDLTGLPDGVLLGRYKLGPVLGRGGSGLVVSAHDLIAGDEVAVKFVPAMNPGARRQLRRELAALLALRLPGVVRLRDEGVDGALTFLVTDRIVGEPFSALAGRGGPEVWLPAVSALLEVLARVHLAGVLHRDLKPANVLVDARGRPTVLDFGLAQGRLVGVPTQPGSFEGTPRYMAPEQRVGGACDERTDLYAVGRMVLELCGAKRDAPDDVALLDGLALPPAFADQVRRMVARDPEDRPRTALDVLAALDRDPLPEPRRLLGPGPWTEAQLQALFVDEPMSLLHLAEDGAALLVAAGGDDADAVCAELRRWLRSGLASWSEDGRVEVTRAALERIGAARPDSPESELVRALDAGTPVEEVVGAARARAAALVADGAVERAAALLEAAALWARGTADEVGVLEDRVAAAIALGQPAAVDGALHAVERSSAPAEARRALEELLRGSRAALAGNAAHAAEVLGRVPGLPPALDRWRHAMRLKAAHRLDVEVHAQILAEAEAALGAEQLGWTAMLRYRQGRWAEAGELAERGHPSDAGLAAAAWLEAGDYARAIACAERAEGFARRARHTADEADARWIGRVTRFRSGEALRPRPDMVDAAWAVRPSAGGLAAVTEASVAWRSGDRRLGAALADRAATVLVGTHPAVSLLAEALGVACGAGPARDLQLRARALPAELEVQVLALLAHGGAPIDLERARLLLAATAPHGERRLDVISLAEAARWLGGAAHGAANPPPSGSNV